MYWIHRWFEKIANALHSESSVIQEEVKEQGNAIRIDLEATKHDQDNAARIIAGAIDKASSAASSYEYPQRDKEHRLQIAIVILTFITALGALAAAAASWVTWREVKRSSDAAKISAEAARDTFEATYERNGIADRTVQQMAYQSAAQFQAAQAAESAAKIAQEALWSSQGANVYTDNPQFNTGPHRGRILVINSGHMASGPAQITVHVVTDKVDPKTGGNGILEYHWSTKRIDSVPLGSNYTVWLYLPQLTPFGLNDGTRMVLLGGSIDYSIGIGGAPLRHWQFCYIVKNVDSPTPCDPVVVDSWKVAYGYPAHKEPFPQQQDMWPVRTP